VTNSLLITEAVMVSMRERIIAPKPATDEEIKQLIRETLVWTYCLKAGKDQSHDRQCRYGDEAKYPWQWCDHCLRYWVFRCITDKDQPSGGQKP
jgi:hypothetical protein